MYHFLQKFVKFLAISTKFPTFLQTFVTSFPQNFVKINFFATFVNFIYKNIPFLKNASIFMVNVLFRLNFSFL